jgi:diaminopimelate decarboxylase
MKKGRPPDSTQRQPITNENLRLPVSPRYMRDRWANFLSQDKRGMLMVEGVPVDQLVQKYGTPLYVMSEREIRDRCRRFKKVFGPNIGLQFAVKCNSNLEILRIVREEGFDLDCSSVGELILGLLADFKPRQLMLTNLYKSEQDLHFAARMGIQAITADSIEEIEHIAATAKKLKKHIDTMIRVNPMMQVGSYSTKGNKYGIPIGYIDRAIDLACSSPYVDFQGFHFMGGYVYQTRVFKAAARAFVKLIKRCQDRGVRVQRLSLGGGFPAAIGDQEAFPIEDMKDFPAYFQRLLDRHGINHQVRLIFEPGKSIVLNSGIGLMKVIAKKRLGKNKRMVIADGSSYNFIPDALVQTDIRYDVLPASKMNSPRIHTVTVAGNTCDCWDLIVRDIDMPKLRAGDLLAAMDVGAYAQVMACNFNTIKRASIVMVAPDGNVRQIRRRDRYSEMFAPELDVLKMAGPNELEQYNNLYRVNIDKMWKGGGFHAHYSKQKTGNGNSNGGGGSKKKQQSRSTDLQSVMDEVEHHKPLDS